MSTTKKQMFWYGLPNTQRFEFRAPAGFQPSLSKHIFWLNRHGRQCQGKTDLFLRIVSEYLAQHADEVEEYCKTHANNSTILKK